MTISILPSAKARDAHANLKAFIEAGKKSTAFGDVDWDADIWDELIVTHSRGSEGRRVRRKFYFLTGKGATRGAERGSPMQQPFVDFLKAALRLQEDAAPKMWTRHNATIAVYRELHDALAEVGYDPCRALPRHFTQAANAIAARATPEGAHQAGLGLQRVASWIDQYGIGRVRLGWKSPIKIARDDNRISAEAAEPRAKKMPSAAALDALPQIAQMVTEPPDIIRMRTVELLSCGGWRINELLDIPEDCEVFETGVENGTERERYGIRYHGAKGFGATIKWIPTPMIDVAKRAIADIRKHTQKVRDDAIWMHKNPGRHPLFENIDTDRLLISEEVREILNLASPETARQWLRLHKVPTDYLRENGLRRALVARARDVEQAILRVACRDAKFGVVPLHEAMFLIRSNAMSTLKQEIAGSIERMSAQKIRDFLSGATGRNNVFGRFGFAEPDGTAIWVHSHQFRHWLNTLAQQGGMTQELIARWSGRKDIQQNAVYDHVTGTELAERVRAMAESGEVVGQIARTREALPLANRAEFMKTQVATAHVTEIGLCVHDWSLVPCAVHGDCAGCVEHIVEKGNPKQKVEAQRQLDEVEAMLVKAETEDREGTYGASRWVSAHRRRRDDLQAVIAVHGDESTPDGTMVHLGDRRRQR